MSAAATFNLVVLWKHELQVAARALNALASLTDEDPPEKHDAALDAALRSCCIALQGAEQPDAVLALVSVDDASLKPGNQAEEPTL